jgi:predicted nucleic acid-binding Zn ribbon protein
MLICAHCTISFSPTDRRQRFCSLSCSNKARAKPRFCKRCGERLRLDQTANQYCSRKCSAAVNNIIGRKHRHQRKERHCDECGTLLKYQKRFCSQRCCGLWVKKQKTLEINKGLVTKRETLRKHLIVIRGHQCEECHLTEWNEKPIPLTLEHSDGDATNNDPINLRILCWNCHAQTATFGARNIGNGRKARGLRQA